MEKVGKDGVINVDDSKGFETSLEVTKGLKYDKGYLSPYMVGEIDKSSVVMENTLVLVTNQKISSIQEILPLLEEISSMSAVSVKGLMAIPPICEEKGQLCKYFEKMQQSDL